MTLDEFTEECRRLNVRGDAELRVQAFGGMRSGKPIRAVSVGFDWDAGAVVLHPAQALTLMPTPRRERDDGGGYAQ